MISAPINPARHQGLMPWLLAAVLVLLLALAGAAIWILDQLQQDARETARDQLRLNVETLHHEIEGVWLEQHLAHLRAWGGSVPSQLSRITESGAAADFWLLDAASGRVLDASRSAEVGQPNPFRHQPLHAEKLAALARGQDQVLLLEREAGKDARVRLLLMLPLGAPGTAPDRYLLALVRNPPSLVESPTRYRLGRSGETYLIDANAQWLSDSRFLAGEERHLRVQVPRGGAINANPEANPEATPGSAPGLTLAADQASRLHRTGASAEPYPDYRGVPVLGAWTWSKKLGIAVISEIDVAEVLAANQQRKQQILFIVIGIGLLSIAVLLALHRQWRRNLDALGDSSTYARTLFEKSLGPVLVSDEHGVIEAVNPAACQLFGFSEEDLVGRNVSRLVPQPHRSRHDAYIRHAETSGQSNIIGSERPVRGVHRNGHEIPVRLGISRAEVNGRRIYIAQLQDLSAIQAQIEKLEQANQALADTTLRAEAASAAKGDFLANMSHEIRTPMNAITGMAELALATELTPRQRNYVSKIRSASEALLRIINDILDFSKIEAGKLTMEQVPFTLDNVLDNLGSLFAEAAEAKGIELAFEVDPDLALSLEGDPLRLGQVLTNLVGNAVKFSDTGTILVQAHAEERTSNNVLLHFQVSDQGIGLNEEQMQNLFTAFSQADSSTTRRFGGTGLGLAISKRLVAMMNGRIWADSHYGVGSTFHFTARFAIQAAAPLELASLVARLAPHAHRPVLVIDDNPIARHVVNAQLRQLGLTAVVCASAAEAFATLEGSDYLLVLSDWKMPEMDGIETLRRLRRHYGDRHLTAPPMLLMTAFSHAEALRQINLQLDGFLAKPTSVAPLYAEIAPLLGIATEGIGQARQQANRNQLVPLRGADILLVEDTEINQEVMLELLSNAGLAVRVANNGVEALEAVSEKVPDCILMDCQMPVMDGYEASRRLRENPRLRDLPIIALTANAMASDRQRCLDAGMNDHVAKPVNLVDLFAALARWVPPRPVLPVEPTEVEALPPEPVTDALPLLPGFDIAAGLAQVSGNAALYRKVLEKLRDQHGEHFDAQYQGAMNSGDPTTAIRLAHSLKGVSRTLGAFHLGDLAYALETATREADPQTMAQARGLVSDEIARLRESLRALANDHHQVFAIKPD